MAMQHLRSSVVFSKRKIKKKDQQTKDEILPLLMQDRYIESQKNNFVCTYSFNSCSQQSDNVLGS